MTGNGGKKRPSKTRDEAAMTPGGPRPKSRVVKVQPGQHATVEDGRLKIIEDDTGASVADLGPVGDSQPAKSRSGRPMKKAVRPNKPK